MGFLLDTNIVSELRKRERCRTSVREWFTEVPFDEIYLSVLLFGEVQRGIEKLRVRDLPASRSLEQWSRGLMLAHKERILDVTLEIARIWGNLTASQTGSIADALLAATAIYHDLTLVTRNTSDFQRFGVDYFNPFED
jgi:hypothetical protein